MTRTLRRVLPGIVLTVGAVIAAFLLFWISRYELHFPLPLDGLLTLAIVAVVLLRGFWFGGLATILSAGLLAYWILPSLGHHRFRGAIDVMAVPGFSAIAILLCALIDKVGSVTNWPRSLDRSALDESRIKLAPVLASMSDAVCLWNQSGQLLDCNQAFASFHRFEDCANFARKLEMYPDFLELYTPSGELLPTDRWPVWRALRGETASDVECQLRRRDTGESWIGSYNFSPIRDAQDKLIGAVLLVRDITSEKQAEELLRQSEARYRLSFQTSFDGMSISRLSDGKYLEVNQALLEMLGYERKDLLGRTSLDLGIWVNLHDRERVFGCLRQRASIRDVQVQFRKKSGETFWALVSSATLEIDGETCIFSAVRDISVARQAEAEIRDLSFFDPLTGLANRRLLMEELQKRVAETAQSDQLRALLFIDLDHFKSLNDSHGYQTGDLLLREVAQRLTASTRENDLVGRLAGDEFVVLLNGLSPDRHEAATQAKAIAEKILTRLEQPYRLNGRECNSTCCIGINLFGNEQGQFNEVLQRADLAMYQAKESGRRTIRFFAPELQAAANARAAMEEDLRRAIRNQEFQLYYQPQFEHGRVSGVEALVRWNHPSRGFLSPGVFIPLAEETHLIFPLSEWVLETACRQIVAWSASARLQGIELAVNVTAGHVRQSDFIDSILSVLERTGAPAEKLKLELTESMLADDIDDITAKMKVLKQHGVRFSLDDFGTGYSSLSYLRQLPLDQLKIDRSFVHDIPTDPGSVAIAQTIISLSQALGMQVIAEGVETSEQERALADLGCHAYQGFLYSKPIPVQELERMLNYVN